MKLTTTVSLHIPTEYSMPSSLLSARLETCRRFFKLPQINRVVFILCYGWYGDTSTRLYILTSPIIIQYSSHHHHHNHHRHRSHWYATIKYNSRSSTGCNHTDLIITSYCHHHHPFVRSNTHLCVLCAVRCIRAIAHVLIYPTCLARIHLFRSMTETRRRRRRRHHRRLVLPAASHCVEDQQVLGWTMMMLWCCFRVRQCCRPHVAVEGRSCSTQVGGGYWAVHPKVYTPFADGIPYDAQIADWLVFTDWWASGVFVFVIYDGQTNAEYRNRIEFDDGRTNESAGGRCNCILCSVYFRVGLSDFSFGKVTISLI